MKEIPAYLHKWSDLAMRQSMQAMLKYLQKQGLTLSQANGLFAIAYHPGLSINALAEHQGVTKAAASQLSDRLVEQGWVERVEDAVDRRAKSLSLTASGQELVASIKQARGSWIDELTESFSKDQNTKLKPALELLIEQLEKFAAEKGSVRRCA